MEIFCGTAGLSAAVEAAGMKALGVDRRRHHVGRKVDSLSMNLAETDDQQRLLELVSSCDSLQMVWMAPPCGTTMVGAGLRTVAEPEGTSTLCGVPRKNVDATNSIYK